MTVHSSHTLSNAERRFAERRFWRNGLIASVLMHLLMFYLWSSEGPLQSPFAAAGPRAGDNRAASGGMQTVSLRIPPPRPIIPPKIPLPTVEPVLQLEMEMEETDRDGVDPG